jgi:Protein of unknown function (DUF3606)
MSDDKKDRGEPDRSRISLSEDYEVRYWTERLGVTKEQLAVAIDKVGNSADAVRRVLGK